MEIEKNNPSELLKTLEENDGWVVYRCGVCGVETTAEPEFSPICDCLQGNKKKQVSRMYATGFIKEKVPKNVIKYIEEENISELFANELHKRIAGENFLKKALILQILGGRLVKNGNPTSFNALIQSASGSGKDWVAYNVVKLLPNSFVEHKTRISEKALNYWHPAEKEPYFSWDQTVIYLEDINNRILNSEVLKTMTSGGSSCSIVIDGELREMKINGNPCFLLTGAYVEPNVEISRRMQIYNLTESESQTKKVLKKQSEIAKNGLSEYNNELRNFNYCLKHVNVSVSFASEIALNFPTQLLARTSYGQFIDFIRCSAALNQYHRKSDICGNIIATEQDYEVAREIFAGIYVERQGLERLTINQKTLLNYFEECGSRELTPSEIFSEIGNKIYTQINNLIKSLNSLCQKGFLKIGKREEFNRNYDTYTFEQPKNTFKLPLFSELFKVNEVTKISQIEDSEEITPFTLLTHDKEDDTLPTKLDQEIDFSKLNLGENDE